MTAAEKRFGKFHVTGLRDPLAPDPAEWLKETKLFASQIMSRWEPYNSLQPRFVLIRATQLLQPPASVSLELLQGVLIARGSAPHRWISDARRLVKAVPGISRFEESFLADLDLKKLEAEMEEAQTMVLRFMHRTAALLPGESASLGRLSARFLSCWS